VASVFIAYDGRNEAKWAMVNLKKMIKEDKKATKAVETVAWIHETNTAVRG
jgi:hypothetical protein